MEPTAVIPTRQSGLEVAEFSTVVVLFLPATDQVHFLRDVHARLFLLCDGARSTAEVIAELAAAGFGSSADLPALVAAALDDFEQMGIVVAASQPPPLRTDSGADAPAVDRVTFPDSGEGNFDPPDLATVTTAVELYQRNGSLLLEHSLDPSLVETMHAHFVEHYATRPIEEVRATSLKVGDGRFMFSIDLEAPYMDPAVYAPARVMPVVKALLGDNCVIQSIGVVCAYPGSRAQHVHRDHPPLFASAPHLGATAPPYALHLVVPLVDLDESTGTTALWNGSHRLAPYAGEREAWSRDGFDGAVMPWPQRGDCYLMDFRLRHGGTPNRSGEPRPLLYIVFSRAWFQDRANFGMQQRLAVGADEFERIPLEHRPLFDDARPDRWQA